MTSTVAHAVACLRAKPSDLSTEAGRARERHRRIAMTTLTSGIVKVITIATSIISVPLTIGYLGQERYGLWMTVTSAASLLAFADLGMGNGLLNAVSRANGANDRQDAKTNVSSAFFLLLDRKSTRLNSSH